MLVLTWRARKVVENLAPEEASQLNHSYVGAEHILLALLRQSDSFAAGVLGKLGIELVQVRKIVQELYSGTTHIHYSPSDLRLSDSAEKAIQNAREEATALRESYVGTEHLLLGLVKDEGSPVNSVLDKLGKSRYEIRARVGSALVEYKTSGRFPQSIEKGKNALTFLVADSLNRLAEAGRDDVQGIAASQIQLLSAYHKLVLDQSQRSFRWALIAAVVGLGFLITSVVVVLIQQTQSAAIITLICGALVEFISAINFYLYGKTSTQVADFEARLAVTQRFLLANSICESLDGDYRQKTRSMLIQRMSGIASGTEDTDNERKET